MKLKIRALAGLGLGTEAITIAELDPECEEALILIEKSQPRLDYLLYMRRL